MTDSGDNGNEALTISQDDPGSSSSRAASRTSARENYISEVVVQQLRSKHSYGTRAILLRIGRLATHEADKKLSENDLKKYEDAITDLCDTLQAHWTNNGVISALLLTMTVPFMVATIEAHYDLDADVGLVLQKAFGILLSVSTAMALCSVLSAATLFMRLNVHMIDVEDKVFFLTHTKLRMPEYFMVASLVTLLSSLVFGTIMAQGVDVGVPMAAAFLAGLAVLALWLFLDNFKVHSYLGPKLSREETQMKSCVVLIIFQSDSASLLDSIVTLILSCFLKVASQGDNILSRSRLVNRLQLKVTDYSIRDVSKIGSLRYLANI
eukprot:g64816.t1